MEKDVIYLIGMDRKSQHVVGLIAKDDGPGGPVFVKRTILQLPPAGRLPHRRAQALWRDYTGVNLDYVVLLLFDEGRLA
jgi:hypothetical protein